MSRYSADIAKYTSPVNKAAVAAIDTHCGIELRNADSSPVSGSDHLHAEATGTLGKLA